MQAAATKIQASFRGHKVREEAQQLREKKSEELKVQASKDAISSSPSNVETQPKEQEPIDIDLNDPEVGAAALKIQASFRGHKARTEVEKIKSSESIAKKETNDQEEKETADKPVDIESSEGTGIIIFVILLKQHNNSSHLSIMS